MTVVLTDKKVVQNFDKQAAADAAPAKKKTTKKKTDTKE